MSIRKNVFSGRVVWLCNMLFRQVVESASLEIFKKRVDIALRAMVRWEILEVGGWLV